MNICISIFLFLMGMVMGSFYMVVALRLPQEESLIYPGSHCEYCNHPLSWFELIPVFSYLLQKGKCRKCGHKLSMGYPITELATGILFTFSYLQFGLSYHFFLSIILSSLLIIIFVSDMRYMIILDSPLILTVILSMILRIIYFDLKTALLAFIPAIITFVIFFIIGKIGDKMFQRESLGGGDIKLSFVMGYILGLPMAIVAFILATFLALPYAVGYLFLKEGHEVPFGPFLISALWIVFVFYDKFNLLINWLFLVG